MAKTVSFNPQDYQEYDELRRVESQKMYHNDDDLTMPKFVRIVMNEWKTNHPPEQP